MNQSYIESCDICIIGGGIVGLTAAALLAETNLSIVVIEKSPAIIQFYADDRPYDLRVSAINPASIKIFEHLNIADKLLSDRANAYRSMQIWDANSDASIEFDAESAGMESLGHIIENNFIINSLLEKLKASSNVIIHAENALERLARRADGIELTAHNLHLQTSLVIGADGQHSQLRAMAGFPLETGLFNQTAMVCRIMTERPHQQTAYQCFHHRGPIAYLPLADGSCSIVWSCDTDYASEIKQLDNKAFAKAVERAMQSRLGKVEVCSPRAAFELAQQHASHYVEPGIALIGDAAHRTHPLAGLGANLGLQDAAVLYEVVTTALAQHRSFSSQATLRKYERKRQPQNALTLNAMQAFKSGFASQTSALTTLRAIALNSADQISPVKTLISELATGTRGDLAEICKH